MYPGSASAGMFPDQANYLSYVFLNILRALGKAHSRPKHFEVILRNSRLQDHAFNLPKYIEPIVQPVLTNLHTLFLDLTSEFPPVQVNMNDVPFECRSYLLKRFLSRVPQLEHLRLNFQFDTNQETNNVLSWLSQSASVILSNNPSVTSLLENPQPVNFTNLRQLDIGMVTIELDILLAILQKYRATLRTISLRKVSLLQAKPVNSGGKLNVWGKFFARLSKLNLKLSAIDLSYLSQEQIGKQDIQSITFKDSSDPHSKRWAGKDMQSGLRDFTNLMIISEPNLNSNSNSSENDSDGKCLNLPYSTCNELVEDLHG
jgi:hypothetical protein